MEDSFQSALITRINQIREEFNISGNLKISLLLGFFLCHPDICPLPLGTSCYLLSSLAFGEPSKRLLSLAAALAAKKCLPDGNAQRLR